MKNVTSPLLLLRMHYKLVLEIYLSIQLILFFLFRPTEDVVCSAYLYM